MRGANVIRLAAILAGLGGSPAGAHSWYPRSCCSERDCGPVLTARKVDGGLWATTAIGTVFVPDSFAWELSPDGATHVCMRPDFDDPHKLVVLCAFRGPGL